MRNEALRQFLMVRRARITPERAGLSAPGGARRVAGLRRDEVASLAGISTGYYRRLERGVVAGVSESVLANLAQALRLDDVERDHLADLLRSPPATNRADSRAPRTKSVRPFVQQWLDATDLPCCVVDDRLDVLAANDLGRALYLPLYESPARPVNHARYIFCDPGAWTFWSDWDAMADLTASLLRGSSGRAPSDLGLCALVDELTARSPDFRRRWAAYDVAADTSGVREINHPTVGRLTLEAHSVPLPEDPGQRMVVHAAAPRSPSQRRMAQLAADHGLVANDGSGSLVPEPRRRELTGRLSE